MTELKSHFKDDTAKCSRYATFVVHHILFVPLYYVVMHTAIKKLLGLSWPAIKAASVIRPGVMKGEGLRQQLHC